MMANLDVLLLGGEEHPEVGHEAGERVCRVHWADHACDAALLQHPVRLLDAPLRLRPAPLKIILNLNAAMSSGHCLGASHFYCLCKAEHEACRLWHD